MPKMRWSEDRLFVVAALALAAIVALSASAATAYVSSNRLVDHTLEVRQAADAWTMSLLDAETSVRGYVVSPAPSMLGPFQSIRTTEPAEVARLRALVADNAPQVERVDATERDARAVLDRLIDLVALVDAGRRDVALARIASGEGQPVMQSFRAGARAIRAEEERLLVERRAQSAARAMTTLLGGLFLVVASFVLLAYTAILQRRRAALVERHAGETRRRLEALSDVASALALARSRSEVADAVVSEGIRAARADTCTLYLLDDTAGKLELIGERGIAREVVAAIRTITATSGPTKTFETLATGLSLWAESENEYLALFPAIASVKTLARRAKAFWSVPLVVEGRPVGLLAMGFYEQQTFTPEERAFVETLTKQCAQALLRAEHLQGEDEARTWFETALRSVGDAVIATDAEGRVSFMNAVAERLTGWTTSEGQSKPLHEVFSIFSETTRQAAENPVAKVLREGRVVGLANHTILRAKGGDEIPIDDSAAPIRDDQERIIGVVMVFRDVSEQKRERAHRDFLTRAGEALASTLDPHRTLASVARFAVPELADWCAVEIVDPKTGVPHQVAVAHVDESKVQFARELGEKYPPDRNAATGVPQVLRSGVSEFYPEIPEALLEAGAQDADHLRIIRELRLRSAIVVPLRRRGQVMGAMTFVFAESGRKYVEADLAFVEDFARRASLAIENAMTFRESEEGADRERALRAEAEIANRAKDEFLATVSHELRTPLNAILGWTLTLRSQGLAPEADRPLSIIERNARSQAKLIEDVLDVSRIISGKLVLTLGVTNVAEAVDAAIETVTPAATAKGIRISSDVADSSLTMAADANRLQQVVWNLLTNAVKFTPKGGSVGIRAFRDGSVVEISVTDSGEGMRPETLAVVFEPFRQADASTTRRHGGLGLGLAIVKQLVAAHGGTVEAKSDGEGKGATFVVRLPARAAVPPLTSPGPRGPTSDSRRLDGLRVLVVDDEEDARLLVRAVLMEQGAVVDVAGSAEEGLEMLVRLRPDIVVSDVGMPEMDGYELIRRIRALPSTRGGRTPAVALSAYARADDESRAIEAGFQKYMTKPIEPEHLVGAVASVAMSRDAVTPPAAAERP
jgi:PAS domain S-box-containing protein